jgi:hypothetical protein
VPSHSQNMGAGWNSVSFARRQGDLASARPAGNWQPEKFMASFPTAGSYRLRQLKVEARVAHDPAAVFAATVGSFVRAILRDRR